MTCKDITFVISRPSFGSQTRPDHLDVSGTFLPYDLGVIHKRRVHQGGRGDLPNANGTVNCYLQKAKICGHRGEGGQKTVKFCGRPLWMTP